MRKIIFLFSIVILFASCSQDDLSQPTSNNESQEVARLTDVNYPLKAEFARALVNVLAENQSARKLIKDESLKKFNYDYDVMYLLINEIPLDDGQTFDDLMLNYIDSDTLNLIKEKLPTLTMFVPELPDNTFSAELWDITKEIPQVAIRTTNTNDVPMIDVSGEEWILEGQYIPLFPVVVVKENERIVWNPNATKTLKSSIGKNTSFAFIHEDYNNSEAKKNLNTKSIVVDGYTIPTDLEKVYQSYDIYSNYSGWQRDYIYYNMTPTQTKGVFNYDYIEHIVGFQLLGDPVTGDAQGIIRKIADQTGDPTQKPDRSGNLTAWTDGEFEFHVKLYIGNILGTGNEMLKIIRASGYDLFSAQTKPNPAYTGIGSNAPRAIFSHLSCNYLKVSQPLFEWDLENISPTIRISVEEYDPSQSTVSTQSTATKFATNFGFDESWGEKVKKGLKFGASAETTKTVTYQVTTTLSSDKLGDVIVNFGDNIIHNKDLIRRQLRGGGRGENRDLNFNQKYTSGDFQIFIAPKLVGAK
jgi:hypothetical protein